MAITLADFSKIWASSSPLTPYTFTDPNYAEGWNFIGGTPPARQMWDSIQKKNDEKMQWLFQGIPVGVVQAFAGSTTPTGWLLCDGSAVSRTDYADLYAVIGDTYGAGDGSTTFNLPNLEDQFIQGSTTAGTAKTAGLPNIKGDFATSIVTASNVAPSDDGGVLYARSNNSLNLKGTSSAYLFYMSIDASRSNSIYGNSTTVQPPAVTMRYIIKY